MLIRQNTVRNGLPSIIVVGMNPDTSECTVVRSTEPHLGRSYLQTGIPNGVKRLGANHMQAYFNEAKVDNFTTANNCDIPPNMMAYIARSHPQNINALYILGKDKEQEGMYDVLYLSGTSAMFRKGAVTDFLSAQLAVKTVFLNFDLVSTKEGVKLVQYKNEYTYTIPKEHKMPKSKNKGV